MKHVSKKMYPAIVAGALLASACIGVNKREPSTVNHGKEQALVFTADSLRWEDSLLADNYRVNVRINGMYPSGGATFLVDSVRAWIAVGLSNREYGNEAVRWESDTALLGNGEALAAAISQDYMRSAKADMESMEQGVPMEPRYVREYEYSFSFFPEFSTDSILTYTFDRYDYTGGAHGSSMRMGQTFATATGKALVASDMFLPEKESALKELLRSGLWNQYFNKEDNGSCGATLKDALLIDPDSLPMPAFPPMCVDTGIVFTYQQYEIACYAAGKPTCILPYRELKPLMRQEVARLLPE